MNKTRPIPGLVRNKGREALFLGMKVTENRYFRAKSFNEVNTLRGALARFESKHGRKFVTRTEGNGLRVWRIK